MVQKVLVIINLVVALAGAGLIFYSHNILKPLPTDQVAEVENLKQGAIEQIQVQPVPIKKFVVNLHSQGSRLRYLDVEMNVLTFSENQKESLKANEHLIKDVVIDIASQLAPEDLDSLSGKLLFEKKIKDRVNEKLGQPGDPIINKIFFSGFIIQ
jgi:flagellar protein FliL